MAIMFHYSLKESLERIIFIKSVEFIIYDSEVVRTYKNSDEVIERYGEMKWALIDLINSKYSSKLKQPFDLYNWLNHKGNDDVAYFINEVGSNSLNYSEFKVPYKFHLFIGKRGFVIGIEQKGSGFDSMKVDKMKIKENEGAGFDFFRNCNSKVFFDNSSEVRIVYLMYIL